MAVTDISNSNLTFTGVPLGVEVTKVTDSSADWASVSNSTYFYDKTDKLIHYKNSGGTVLEIFSAAGGLTYFTEAQNTAAPNATVPVDSLTATGAATNIDVAIVPKGTGALTLAIPDSTATGGNKRGANAVDLQTTRNAASRVASGANSVVLGGTSNTASNSNTIAGGNLSTASGNQSVALINGTASNTSAIAIGSNVTASGVSSVSIGSDNNVASSDYAVALGYNHTASGQGSFCVGMGNIANGSRSTALGNNSHTFGIFGRFAYSSGQESTSGDSQTSKFILRERTTGNTATTITTDSGAAGTANQVILSNQSAYRFKGTIIGKQSGSTNVAAWDVDGIIVRGANAAATTLSLGNLTLVQNTPAWGTPTLAADTTNGGLRVQVTGATATNIQWTAVIETTEVIYA